MDEVIGKMVVVVPRAGWFREDTGVLCEVELGDDSVAGRFLVVKGSVGLVTETKLFGGDREDYRWVRAVFPSGHGWIPMLMCHVVGEP